MRFGSWYLVFAAYNAGYGAVLRSITNYNTNDYWELVKHESGLPWESSVYVPKILAAAIVGRNQAAFGFGEVTPDPPFAYEEVEVPAGTTLATVARAAGAKTEVIEALNPHLLREPDAARARARRACACRREPRPSTPPNIDKARGGRQGRHRGAALRRDAGRRRAGARPRGARAAAAERRQGLGRAARRDGDRRAAKRGGAATARTSAARRRRRRRARRRGRSRRRPATTTPCWSRCPSGRSATRDASASSTGRATATASTRSPTRSACAARSSCEWNNVDPGAKLHPRMVLQIFVRKDFDPAGVMLLDPAKVRVVTLGSEEFLELETARRGKKRLFYTAKSGRHAGQARAPLRADAGRSRAHQPVLVQHGAARRRAHRRLFADGRGAPRAHDGDDAGEEAPRARRDHRRRDARRRRTRPPRRSRRRRSPRSDDEAGRQAAAKPAASPDGQVRQADKAGSRTRSPTRRPTRPRGKKK